MRDIKIVLLGDASVGKSSLVTSLVKDSFSPRVQPVVPEILLPLDVTDAGVTTRIVDTVSSQKGTGGSDGSQDPGSSKDAATGQSGKDRRAHLEASVRTADVLLLVYDISRPTTFDRIPTYWLPYLRTLIGSSRHVPVILVGNKIDTRSEAGGANDQQQLEEELAPIMAEFGEVESCIETSVKEGVNVSEVFYYAQKAVLYPSSPLYDGKTHSLKPSCIAALKRIFLLCDHDKDSLLSDEELQDFQRRCFGSPLSQQELEAIKDLVVATPYYGPGPSRPRSSTGASSSSNGHHADASSASYYSHPNLSPSGHLTLSGWLHLHTLFIQRGRLETTWSVLHSYGYIGPHLQLSPDYLNPPTFHVPSDCAVELSPYGYSFLTDVFEQHDADRDGALCTAELEALFATVPPPGEGRHPWVGSGFPDRTTTTDENGAVTLQGWLAQWSMTTLLDYRLTLRYLAYLGYPGRAKWGAEGVKRDGGKPGPPPTGTALKLTRKNTRSLFSSAWSSYTGGSSASYQSPPSQKSGPAAGGEPGSSSKKTKKKKGDPSERSVFLAYVLGAPGAGKSSLLNAALGKRFDSDEGVTNEARSVVSAVEPHLYYSTTHDGQRGPPLVVGSTGGYERYLVLQEFPTDSAAKQGNKSSSSDSSTLPLTESSAARQALNSADLVLLLYDSSDSTSFSYLSNLRQRYASSLGSCPTLFVATKADRETAQQRHEVQPEVYVRRLGVERWSPVWVCVGGNAGTGVAGSAAGGMLGDSIELGASASSASIAPTGNPAATTTSITQLLAVACAIAQDPRGNAAVPGLKAAHDRRGAGRGWGSWLAGLVGLGGTGASSEGEKGGLDAEDGDDGSDDEDDDASSQGEESPESLSSSATSSGVAGKLSTGGNRRRSRRSSQQGSKPRSSGRRKSAKHQQRAAAVMEMQRQRRRRALLVAFGIVIVGGGAAAVALGLFDLAGPTSVSRASTASRRGGASGRSGDVMSAPRRWAATASGWAQTAGRALAWSQ